MKRFLRKIIRFLFFCVLLFTLFILIFIFCGKRLIKRENLSEYIKTADILNMEANIIFDIDNNDSSLKDELFNLGIKQGIPKTIMDDIINSKEINILLGEYFNKIIYYLVNKQEKPQIEQDVIIKITDIAINSLNDNINIMMEEKELSKKISKFCIELSNIVPNRQEMIGKLPLSFLNKIINFDYRIFYYILLIIFLFYVLSTNSFYKPLRYFGLSFIIVGSFYVIIGSLNNTINNLVLDNVVNLKIMIEPLITILLTIFFKTGVLLSFLGIFLVIFYIVMNRISINKELFNK